MTKRHPPANREKAPLDRASLHELALSYVARFSTTRAKLGRYLARKMRERGWVNDPDGGGGAEICEAIVMRMADLGYVDDRQYAEARGRAMTGRGLGVRRIKTQMWVDGIAADDAETALDAATAAAPDAAIRFARRRRFGPFASEQTSDPAIRQRQLAAFLRAGHAMDLARRILDIAPGDEASLEALDADAMLD